MQLEIGKKYVDRNGNIHKIIGGSGNIVYSDTARYFMTNGVVLVYSPAHNQYFVPVEASNDNLVSEHCGPVITTNDVQGVMRQVYHDGLLFSEMFVPNDKDKKDFLAEDRWSPIDDVEFEVDEVEPVREKFIDDNDDDLLIRETKTGRDSFDFDGFH